MAGDTDIVGDVEHAATYGLGDFAGEIAILMTTDGRKTYAGICDKEQARALLDTLLEMMGERGWLGDA